MCKVALQEQQCHLPGRGDSSTVYIHSGSTNQVLLEKNLTSQLQLFETLAPSPNCLSAIFPFMCSYTFILCDEIGTLHRPSSEQCVYIRNVTCKSEWDLAIRLGAEDMMPKCHLLPETTLLKKNYTQTGTPLSSCSRVGRVYIYKFTL